MRTLPLACFLFLSVFAYGQDADNEFAERHVDAISRYRKALFEEHTEDLKALDSLAETVEGLTRKQALRVFYHLILYNDLILWPYDAKDYEAMRSRKKKLLKEISPEQARIISNCKPMIELIGDNLLSSDYPFEVAPPDDFDVRLLQFIQPEKGEVVAEVGAGNGYYGLLLAAAYPEALFVLNELNGMFVEYMNQKIALFSEIYGEDRVWSIMGSERMTMMKTGSVNHLVVANTYHHFSKEEEMLASIRETLKKTGSLYVIEPNYHGKRDRKAADCRDVLPRVKVVEQITSAGFRLVEEQALEEWYFLRFEVAY